MKIPFSPPYIDDTVINEVVDSLRSGWITSGPKVKALEEEIKSFSGAKEVLCVNSWTSGAIMMLRWLGVKADDEVIVPAYTYSATALAVLHADGGLRYGFQYLGRCHSQCDYFKNQSYYSCGYRRFSL